MDITKVIAAMAIASSGSFCGAEANREIAEIKERLSGHQAHLVSMSAPKIPAPASEEMKTRPKHMSLWKRS